MKVVFAFLFLFSAFAYADSTPVVDPVRGNWTIESRICSSGAPVRDAFWIGRDELTLSLFDGKYETHTRINGCHYWATGFYNVQGSMLRVYGVTGASNCTHQPPAREGTVMFNSVDGKLKIYTGPFGPGGSCPARDLLEATFRAL